MDERGCRYSSFPSYCSQLYGHSRPDRLSLGKTASPPGTRWTGCGSERRSLASPAEVRYYSDRATPELSGNKVKSPQSTPRSHVWATEGWLHEYTDACIHWWILYTGAGRPELETNHSSSRWQEEIRAQLKSEYKVDTGIWRRVVWYKGADVSEKAAASIFSA